MAIAGTVDKVGGYSYTMGNNPKFPGLTHNNEMGMGRVNALSALEKTAGGPISGPALICTTGSFSFPALPTGSSVSSWTTNSSGLTINSSGVATRQAGYSGEVTVTGTVNIPNACAPVKIKKKVWVGNPVVVGAGQLQFDECTHQLYISPNNPSMGTWSVISGSVSIGSTTGYSIYASSTTGGVVAVTVSNACGSSSQVTFNIPGCGAGLIAYPNPAKDKINIKFANSEASEAIPESIELFSEVSTFPAISLSKAEITGQVSSNGILELNVKDLHRGTYFLHLVFPKHLNRKTQIKKFILE